MRVIFFVYVILYFCLGFTICDSDKSVDTEYTSRKQLGDAKPEDVPLNLEAQQITSHSMTLSWSAPIKLSPTKYKISFDATKEFINSEGMTQIRNFPKVEILLDAHVSIYTVNELSPFTTYNVNVTAVPADNSNHPPAQIAVTTQMIPPPPMFKPDFYEVVNGQEIRIILPQASEEYGPISHYYLVVVPENKETNTKTPDQYVLHEITSNTENSDLPYIAAKFPLRNIPYVYNLGTGENHDGFINYKVKRGKRYRVFVRAVVDTPQKDGYTNSPFSDFFSL